MSVPRESHFAMPHVPAASWRPLGRQVLVRVEDPPQRDVAVWTPFHEERAAGLGFVVYGVVVAVGDGAWEPAWVTDPKTGARVRDGRQRGAPTEKVMVRGRGRVEDQVHEVPTPTRLVWTPVRVRVGQRVVWGHGWGPSVELAEGTHFSIYEDGLLGEWDPGHVHCPHLRIEAISKMARATLDQLMNGTIIAPASIYCCDPSCDWSSTLNAFATCLDGCGTKDPRLAPALIGKNPQRIEVAHDPAPLAMREGPDSDAPQRRPRKSDPKNPVGFADLTDTQVKRFAERIEGAMKELEE